MRDPYFSARSVKCEKMDHSYKTSSLVDFHPYPFPKSYDPLFFTSGSGDLIVNFGGSTGLGSIKHAIF